MDRNDPYWPGLTFPGGHVEDHETFHDSVVREVKEETNLDIKTLAYVALSNFMMKMITAILFFFI